MTEGLLRYLNFEQKTVVANNIHALLEKFGGIWVTPDIAVVPHHDRDNTKGHQAGVLKLSGIDLEKNRFPDTESGRKFMENLGFSVERDLSVGMLDELTSPRNVDMTIGEVRKSLEGRETFVMKAIQNP